MNCEICNKDIGDIIVILPIRQEDGRLNTLACLECSIERPDVYCLKHDMPHVGYSDNTSICMKCFEEEFSSNRGNALQVYLQLKLSLSPRKLSKLKERAGYAFLPKEVRKEAILKILINYALRRKIGLQRLIEQLIQEQSIGAPIGAEKRK